MILGWVHGSFGIVVRERVVVVIGARFLHDLVLFLSVLAQVDNGVGLVF